MPEVAVVNSEGAEVGKIALSPEVFEVQADPSLIYRAVIDHLAKLRTGTADTKTRGEVNGGGKKPFKQKGTGRARQGTTRAPHWPGGGVVFGPHPRDYSVEMPKKQRRLANRAALSAKVADGQFIVMDDLKLDAISTKSLVKALSGIGVVGKKTMLVIAESNEAIRKSGWNIPWLTVRVAPFYCTYDLLNSDAVVFTKDAVVKVQEAQAK